MFEWAQHGTTIGDVPPEYTEAGSEQVLGRETKEQWQTRAGEAAKSFTLEN